MKPFQYSSIKIVLAALILSSILVAAAPVAHAQAPDCSFWSGFPPAAALCAGKKITNLFRSLSGLWETYKGVEENGFLWLFYTMSAGMVTTGADLLTSALFSPFQNFARTTVVQDLWTTVRDVVNMFFILGLLIAAFGTIFNIQRISARELLPKIIVSALVINFSLVIGQVIIDIFNFMTFAFLQAIGDISTRVGELGRFADLVPAPAASEDLTAALVSYGPLIMLNIVAAIGLFLGAGFVILRIPILAFFLVISPLAWLLYILPYTRSWYHQWWQKFLSWCYFLPLYVFFIFLGLSFIHRGQASILQNIAPGESIFGEMSLTALATFVMAMFTIYGAFAISLKVGGAGAASSIGAVTGAWGLAGGARWVSGRTGLTGAVGRIRKQIREEGLYVGGKRLTAGARGQTERELRRARQIAKPLGGEVRRGVNLQEEQEKLKRIHTERDKLRAEKLENKIDNAGIMAKARGKGDEADAAKQLAFSEGIVTDEREIAQFLRELNLGTRKGKEAAEELVKNASDDVKEKLGNVFTKGSTLETELGTQAPIMTELLVQNIKDDDFKMFNDPDKLRTATGHLKSRGRAPLVEKLNRTVSKKYLHTAKVAEHAPAGMDLTNPSNVTTREKIIQDIKTGLNDRYGKTGNWDHLKSQDLTAFKSTEFKEAVKRILDGASDRNAMQGEMINKLKGDTEKRKIVETL